MHQVKYKFFWGGTEYQLMAFAGDPDDWDDEDLIGVYSQNMATSLNMALLDIIDDSISRQCQQYTIEVDLIPS